MHSNTDENRQFNNSTELKHRTIGLGAGVLITLAALAVATFAWYIYNTNAHTTRVHMAAGTSTKLEIAKEYDGEYSSSVELESFHGVLDPVSTDKITNGFQKVTGFIEDSGKKSGKLANLFGTAESSDYFKTTLYLRTNATKQGIYVCNIEFADDASAKLMATAMRVGFVVHEPGEDQPVECEYIFSISDEHNPDGEYNTYNGKDGDVLDSTKTDGSVVESPEHTPDEFVDYDSSTGIVTRKASSLKLFELTGSGSKKAGTPVQVDVYLWLEGCDSDCTGTLGSGVLRDVAVSFAAYAD